MESIKISTIDELKSLYAEYRVDTIYIKHLSLNQDNERNQIYLGKVLNSLTNILPGAVSFRSASESKSKKLSAYGKLKVELNLDFFWILRDGSIKQSPSAKIVDYFQYPEVRLTGFLKDVRDEGTLNPLRREYQDAFGKRILCLGVNKDRQIFGLVITELEDPIVSKFPVLPDFAPAPILKTLVVGNNVGLTPLQTLVSELGAITGNVWHKSIHLSSKATDGKPQPFKGNQGGGYTLEALLGIPSNGIAAPDKHGIEIKSYGSKKSRISLMTPVGNLGFRGKYGFKPFIRKFGMKAKKQGDPRTRFTGTYRVGNTLKKTNLTMLLNGYDPKTGKITHNDVELVLEDLIYGITATGWSIDRLANIWNKKHSSAIYIASTKRKLTNDPLHDAEYQYSTTAYLGEGTNVLRLLDALAKGHVVYDPGDEIEAIGSTTKYSNERPQFRISKAKLLTIMSVLYDKVFILDLSVPGGSPKLYQP